MLDRRRSRLPVPNETKNNYLSHLMKLSWFLSARAGGDACGPRTTVRLGLYSHLDSELFEQYFVVFLLIAQRTFFAYAITRHDETHVAKRDPSVTCRE